MKKLGPLSYTPSVFRCYTFISRLRSVFYRLFDEKWKFLHRLFPQSFFNPIFKTFLGLKKFVAFHLTNLEEPTLEFVNR
jgi:hypothetical protein